MADKKHEQSSFTVTDRRLFTSEGELRTEMAEEVAEKEVERPKPATPPAASVDAAPPDHAEAPTLIQPAGAPDMPALPTATEQKAQADAYQKSARELDSQVELSGHSAKEFEMSFERFMASLYMTAMVQMGLMHQQGEQPRVDIIGARQTIDTLTLIAAKTKGNLTPVEENFLQNSLYELRMAYVEVTNALARPPADRPLAGPATGTRGR